MEKLYRILLLILAMLLGIVIVVTAYYALTCDQTLPLPFIPESQPGRRFLALLILSLCFFLTSSLLVVRKRVACRSEKTQSIIHLLKNVFNGLSTGLVVFDRYGKVQYSNPAFCKFIGFDNPNEIYMAHYTELIEPLLIPVSEKLASAIDSGEEFTREYRVFLTSGIKCFKSEFYSINDPQLGKTSVLHLEDRTREDLIKQKLSRQLEETYRYALSKDNFYANMSHEIRTPINAVLGMAYFAKKFSTDDKATDYIQKIENASELLLDVVNDILDFSKMQENKFALNPEVFNLYDLRKILLDLFVLKARQKGLCFSVEFNCSDPFFVFGDQFRLTQIFMNLVGNALKFTEHGLVAVSLNYEKIGKDIILRCSIRDTGCGLSEEDISKLFTDFEQFGQVLIKSHEGTGLGLAISKRLVELMNGVLWVDSQLDKGSSFYFVVVLSEPKEGHPQLANLPKINKKSGRVLIVEDNDINSEIAITLLSSLGYSGECVQTGAQAIERLQSRDLEYYDAILIDAQLSQITLKEVVRIIKTKIGITSPILAVSPLEDHSLATVDLLEGLDGYLSKPYNPDEFKKLFPDFNV
ncbi:MAG TPA: response regulator [Treponema sp.]|nr:response regulator [Treponema sp.]